MGLQGLTESGLSWVVDTKVVVGSHTWFFGNLTWSVASTRWEGKHWQSSTCQGDSTRIYTQLLLLSFKQVQVWALLGHQAIACRVMKLSWTVSIDESEGLHKPWGGDDRMVVGSIRNDEFKRLVCIMMSSCLVDVVMSIMQIWELDCNH